MNLNELADRVERASGADNSLDVEVECALFVPDETCLTMRPNAAGTKIICGEPDGRERAYWAYDHTSNAEQRALVAAALRSRAAQEESNHERA